MPNMRIIVNQMNGNQWVMVSPVNQTHIDGTNVIGNWMCQAQGVMTNEPCNNIAPGMENFSFEAWVEAGMPD